METLRALASISDANIAKAMETFSKKAALSWHLTKGSLLLLQTKWEPPE